MKICIISGCTEDYYQRLYILYLGLRKFHKKIYFHAHLINMKKTTQLEEIEDNFLTITKSTIKTEDKEVIKNYASNIRAGLFSDLIQKYDKIFWFDADTIIRKDISQLFSFLNKNMIVAYKNFNPKYKFFTKGEFKTGIIGFRKIPLIIKILNEWKNETFKNGTDKCFWFQDQILITKLIFKYYNYLSIHNLPKKFIDWDFDEKSLIWVGKGERKNDKKYLSEEKKFLDIC